MPTLIVNKSPHNFPAKRLAYSIAKQKVNNLKVLIEDGALLPIFKEFSSVYSTETLTEKPTGYCVICDCSIIFDEGSLTELFKQNTPHYLITKQLDPETLDCLDDYGANFFDNMKKRCLETDYIRVISTNNLNKDADTLTKLEKYVFIHPYPELPTIEINI